MTQNPTSRPAHEPFADAGIARFGLYVVASDLERSATFYEHLFQKPPQIRTPGLVGFDVRGALFAIISQQTYAPDVKRGDNVLPYLHVKDLDAEFARVRQLDGVSVRTDGVVSEGAFRFVKLADPDGNLIELFAITLQPA